MKIKQIKVGSSALMLGVCMLLSFAANAQQANKAMSDNKMMDGDMKQASYIIPQKPKDISPLLDGEKIPVITLEDVSGKSFDLNMAVAEKPTILIFYRGGWCPFCSKQLAALQEITPGLEKEGYQIIAISTDKPEGLVQSATKEKLSYTLLSDADLNAAKQFGIAYKAPKGYWEMLPKTTGGKNVDLLLPVPSVYILDRKGIIRFEYINPDFKQRLSPELLTAVSQTLKKDL